jgi:branched-chain amino acid transport system permease protein
LHLVVNDAGSMSLAHGSLVAVGAFTAAHLAGRGGFGLALVGSTVAAAGLGGVVALPLLRMQGFTVAITTWLFAIAVDRFLLTKSWFVGEAAGLPLGEVRVGGVVLGEARSQLVVVCVVAAVMLWAAGRIRASRFGHALWAVRSNEAMASAVGIDVRASKIAVFVVAGAYAGVAGALWVLLLGRAVPSSFPPLLSVTFLAVVIIGGRGSLWGPVGAAFLFSAGPELFGGLGRLLLYLSAVVLVVVLVRFPGGLNEQGRHLAHLIGRGRR